MDRYIYYVAHPGGRSYDDLRVNVYAAETWRVTRFWDYGHTPGVIIRPPLANTPVAASDMPLQAKLASLKQYPE